MKFKFHTYDYESIYRPNYELYIALSYFVCAGASLLCFFITDLPLGAVLGYIAIYLALGCLAVLPARRLINIHTRLNGSPLQFIDLKRFTDLTREYKRQKKIYFGTGFVWTSEHTQRAHEILKHPFAKETFAPPTALEIFAARKKMVLQDLSACHGAAKLLRLPAAMAKARSATFERAEDHPGQHWIHGLNTEDYRPIAVPEEFFKVHLFILGTTGSGKTRLADLLISQAIMRGECQIIIDPKGDKEMRDNARRACELYREDCIKSGRGDPGDRFYYFHPADPKGSVRINFLSNSTYDTDIASRILQLIPANGNNASFRNFCWEAVNAVVEALLICEIQPTLRLIKTHLEDQLKQIMPSAMQKYCEKQDELHLSRDGDMGHAPYQMLYNRVYNDKLPNAYSEAEARRETLIEIYRNYYQDRRLGTASLDNAITKYAHATEHYKKMIVSITPLLTKLTAGDLSYMLSPDYGSSDLQASPILDTHTLYKRAGVLYLGLDSMSDPEVAGAIGAMALSDLASLAGNIYNFASEFPPVNIFVDEAAECLCDSAITLLNKGRGAGVRMCIATQSIADFTNRLGSEAKKDQVLANLNNIIALRLEDTASAQWICDKAPKTVVKTLHVSQGISALTINPMLHGGSQSEQLTEEEESLIPADILGLLPNLEYIAKFAGGTFVKGVLPILGTPRNLTPDISVTKKNNGKERK